jgi:hypothetical protein
MASSTKACEASAKPSTEIPEVPAGCDQEQQLLEALTAIPLITKAIARPDASSSGQRVDITVGPGLHVLCMRMAHSTHTHQALLVSDQCMHVSVSSAVGVTTMLCWQAIVESVCGAPGWGVCMSA